MFVQTRRIKMQINTVCIVNCRRHIIFEPDFWGESIPLYYSFIQIVLTQLH